jgi:hypothetical protein
MEFIAINILFSYMGPEGNSDHHYDTKRGNSRYWGSSGKRLL